MIDYVWPIIITLSIFGICLLIARFVGFANTRCYSPESNQCQGRLRIDDCNDIECHKNWQCKYFTSSLKEYSTKR